MSDVADTQVGGSHYTSLPIEPWDIIEKNGLDFWEGSAISYLLRWRSKGGAVDLEKMIHYVQKMIEMNRSGEYGPRPD